MIAVLQKNVHNSYNLRGKSFIFTWGEVGKGLAEDKVKANNGLGNIRKSDVIGALESLCMCVFDF